MSADPRELQQQVSYYEQRIKSLQNQREQFNELIAETNQSITTLKGVQDRTNETSTLLPLAGGVMLKTKVADFENLLVNVGAGTYIPKSLNDGIEALEQQVHSFSDFITTLNEEITKTSQAITQIQQQIQNSQNWGITP